MQYPVDILFSTRSMSIPSLKSQAGKILAKWVMSHDQVPILATTDSKIHQHVSLYLKGGFLGQFLTTMGGLMKLEDLYDKTQMQALVQRVLQQVEKKECQSVTETLKTHLQRFQARILFDQKQFVQYLYEMGLAGVFTQPLLTYNFKMVFYKLWWNPKIYVPQCALLRKEKMGLGAHSLQFVCHLTKEPPNVKEPVPINYPSREPLTDVSYYYKQLCCINEASRTKRLPEVMAMGLDLYQDYPTGPCNIYLFCYMTMAASEMCLGTAVTLSLLCQATALVCNLYDCFCMCQAAQTVMFNLGALKLEKFFSNIATKNGVLVCTECKPS